MILATYPCLTLGDNNIHYSYIKTKEMYIIYNVQKMKITKTYNSVENTK